MTFAVIPPHTHTQSCLYHVVYLKARWTRAPQLCRWRLFSIPQHPSASPATPLSKSTGFQAPIPNSHSGTLALYFTRLHQSFNCTGCLVGKSPTTTPTGAQKATSIPLLRQEQELGPLNHQLCQIWSQQTGARSEAAIRSVCMVPSLPCSYCVFTAFCFAQIRPSSQGSSWSI